MMHCLNPSRVTTGFSILALGPQGRLATLENGLSHARQLGILPMRAKEIVHRIAGEVGEWRTFFESGMVL